MVTIPAVPEGAIDTCGTGGDELSTFNISTAAALITASAGVPVAKHGNRAVSSNCGSADVLHALGFEIDPGVEVVTSALNETRFAFLFAPRFHPAMKHAVAPRREIGVRTIFNILGPLCNPAGVKRQIVGVYDPAGITRIAEVLGALGSERVLVVSGPDGADELLPPQLPQRLGQVIARPGQASDPCPRVLVGKCSGRIIALTKDPYLTNTYSGCNTITLQLNFKATLSAQVSGTSAAGGTWSATLDSTTVGPGTVTVKLCLTGTNVNAGALPCAETSEVASVTLSLLPSGW